MHFTHLGVNDEDEMEFGQKLGEVWKTLQDDTRLRYACGQLERGEGGRLHAQIYTEWNTSLRLNQVAKVLPSHLEPVRGTRTQARDYCRKAEGREFALPDLGVWRAERGDPSFNKEEGPKARALKLITEEGLHPHQIAAKDPEAYFIFGAQIDRLYLALKEAGALPKPKVEVLPESRPPSSDEEE